MKTKYLFFNNEVCVKLNLLKLWSINNVDFWIIFN